MAPRSSLPDPSHTDYDAINLRRALPRLEEKILNPDPRLLRSSYERRKTASNLEYARTLLLRLERGASLRPRAKATGTAPGTPRTDLAPQRARLKRLHDRLYELNQRYDDGDADDGGGSDGSEGEDLLAKYCSPPAVAADVPAPPTPRSAGSGQTPASSRTEGPTTANRPQTTTASMGVRPRRGDPSTALSPVATTTSSAHRPSAGSPPGTSTPATATALETQTSAQNDLTSSLLGMAAALKDSARAFGADLDADAAALAATEGSLGKSHTRMGAATSQMGVLRRMSEGRWWWGRMLLYAVIAALWLVALLLVFVGPKLRF